MIKTLYVNGCSWTAGNELEQDLEFDLHIDNLGLYKEDPADPFNWNLLDKKTHKLSAVYSDFYNEFNWGKHIADAVDAKYINESKGGGSNARIVRTTLDYVLSLSEQDRKELLIVIGWTCSDRSEIYLENAWQLWNNTQPFGQTVDRLLFDNEKTISAVERIQEQSCVYLNSDTANMQNYFQLVYLLANTLENLGVKFFFFNALPAWWIGGDLQCKINVEEQFKSYITWHEQHNNILGATDSMYAFIHDNRLPVAKYLHPLCYGHRAWAAYLLDNLQARGII
jgi:hypothetical protein